MLSRTKQYLHARLSQRDPFDLASALLLAALVIGALLVVRDYAISNDEEVQHRYGEMILAYYASGFTDTSLFDFRNLYLYGGLFDIVAVLLSRALPFDPYLIRHVLCALTGIGGIAAAWATARLIAGPRAGMFAATALAFCGPYFGSMFNHTKDIPFAAAAMGATYFLIRTARALPQPRLRDVLGFGLLLGAALGLRATGLLILLYVPLAIALRTPSPIASLPAARFALRSFASFMPAFILAYLIMVFTWPWAALELFNPVRAIFTFTHFHYPIRTLLFGVTYEMGEVPRWYIPAYLAIKLPLTILFGAALGLILSVVGPRARNERAATGRRREIMFIAIIAAFPVLCQVIVNGPAFTGMRHFLFVVPLLAVLAGIGFDGALDWLAVRQRELAAGAFAAIGIWFAWNASMLVHLHPYEYMFYNPIVGGLEGAQRGYEADYWVNIMNEAVDGLEDYVARIDRDSKSDLNDSKKTYTVAVCGERLPFEKEAHAPLKYSDDWDKADFFIAPTQMNCDRAMYGNTVVAIERLGVVIGVVKDMRGMSTAARWPAIEVARKPSTTPSLKTKL